MMKKILIVDDELSVRESLRMTLKQDYQVIAASNADEALRALEEEVPDVVLLDVIMPEMDGLTALERLRAINSQVPILMLTATQTRLTAFQAGRLGAYDYITKPFEVEDLKIRITRALENEALRAENRELRSEVMRRYQFGNIIGKSKEMNRVFRTIEQIAGTKTTVLITGESGTGKELVAKAIHYNSPRGTKSFVAINCAAIPESLIESELFGHERGAFTDARSRQIGKFELAEGGTLLLDEIGELATTTQAKILRVLQEKEIQRVGGTETIRIDVRLIAATNKDLENAIAKGTFRSDLFYRINVVPLFLPPLRERREDISLLVDHFLKKVATGTNRRPKRFSQKALDLLTNYDWPGNVREMENVVERVVALTDADIIEEKDLPDEIVNNYRVNFLRREVLSGTIDFEKAERRFEEDILVGALERCNYVQTQAAEMLGITRRMLKYKMDKLGIPTKGED
ncbi:MAG: Fis family transcriptional regulator [Deltaproteobacteria bacterium RBG_13_65_10]|jgi:DNA-binding NtrC family response regulator|nr:MAG: Fis family transcriptional regulator [Deltaproteobacteria bacterium RBG_13_65_10]